MDAIEIKISTPYITLGQFLKLTGLIDNGGEAKMFLQYQTVMIDGEKDNRRGRKLYPGSKVEVMNRLFVIEGTCL